MRQFLVQNRFRLHCSYHLGTGLSPVFFYWRCCWTVGHRKLFETTDKPLTSHLPCFPWLFTFAGVVTHKEQRVASLYLPKSLAY
jgi:hypothetical protein